MVFGGITHERLQLNESTIWTGRPRSYAHSGSVDYLGQIREILQKMRKCERTGDFKKAEEWQTKAEDLALEEFMSIPLHQTSYEPLADLYIDFPGHSDAENYRRELDLTTGLVKVSYESGGTHYTRESFASYPDKCIVTRIKADKPGTLSLIIRLSSPDVANKNAPVACRVKSITESGIVLSGRVVKGTDMGDDDSVIRYEVHLNVNANGGKIVKEDANEIQI